MKRLNSMARVSFRKWRSRQPWYRDEIHVRQNGVISDCAERSFIAGFRFGIRTLSSKKP